MEIDIGMTALGVLMLRRTSSCEVLLYWILEMGVSKEEREQQQAEEELVIEAEVLKME